MAIDTNESLEMTIEADADAAGKELDELIVKLGEVIAQLNRVKGSKRSGLLPGLQDALANILDLRKQIAGLTIRRAKFAPDSKDWKKVDAQISEANYQLDKFVATANDLIGKAIVPQVDTHEIDDAVKKIEELKDDAQSAPTVPSLWGDKQKINAAVYGRETEMWLRDRDAGLIDEHGNRKEVVTVDIKIQNTEDLAKAQKHIAALENAIERNKHNMRKFQISGDDDKLSKEAAALRANEALLKRYEAAVSSAFGAWHHMDDAGFIWIRNVEEYEQAERAAKRLEKSIENDTAAMRRFSAANDAVGVERMKAKLEGSIVALRRYNKALADAADIGKQRMGDAGIIKIENVEDFEVAERAAKKLEKSIENDTAAMHRFAAANDAAGVERMKAKLEGSVAALDRYNKALAGAADIGKRRDQMSQLADLYADIDKIKNRIATSKGGDQMFVNNTATVRRLKLEMLQAEMQARKLSRALGAADTGGAFRQSAKYIGLSLINMVKLRAEAKRGKKAVIDMSRALSLMAFRMTIRTMMRLTREGIENLAKYSREVDNAFNGALSRMMSKVTELKNSFAAAIAPVIQAIEPYVVRIANFLINAFNQLSLLMASIFGQKTFYKAIPVTEDYAESLDGAANSAKKLQKQLMGIDELTVLQDPNAGASGVTPGRADPADMFTIEKVAEHQGDLQNIKDKLREALPYAIGIGTALAAWHIAPAVINGIETISRLNRIFGSAKPMQMLGGGALAIGGGLTEAFSIIDAIKNGLDGLNFAGILGGGGMLAGGAALIGKALGKGILGGAIGGIVAGVPAFVTGVYDALTGGLDTLNALLISAGATAAGAGIGAVVGMMGGPIGAGLGALIGLAVGALTDLGILIYQKWDEITLWFNTNVAKPIGETFTKLWGQIQEIFAPVTNWFSTNIIQPIAGFFSELGKTIGAVFEGAWMVARAVWSVVSGWFNTNVVQPIVQFWNAAKETLATLWQQMKANLEEPFRQACETVKKIFSALWTGIKVAAAAAFNAVIGKIESMINKVVRGVNSLIGGFNKVVKWAANVLGESWGGVTELKTVSLGRINVYGDGGFPSMGELFIANERGPEYIGRMGSRNVVANNDQIVQGIAYGVAEANDALISVAYAVADRIVQAIADKDMNTYIDTRKITTAQQNRSRAYGV